MQLGEAGRKVRSGGKGVRVVVVNRITRTVLPSWWQQLRWPLNQVVAPEPVSDKTALKASIWSERNLQLRVGDTVLWAWDHGPCNVTGKRSGLGFGKDERFDSGPPTSKGSFAKTFERGGTYEICSTVPQSQDHLRNNMFCRVTVRTDVTQLLHATGSKMIQLMCAAILLLVFVVGCLLVLDSQLSPLLPDEDSLFGAVVYKLFAVLRIYFLPPLIVGAGLLAVIIPGSFLLSLPPPKLTSFGRGYGPRVHTAVRVCVLLLLAGLLVALVLNWQATVRSTKAVMDVFNRAASLLAVNLHTVDIVVSDAEALLTWLADNPTVAPEMREALGLGSLGAVDGPLSEGLVRVRGIRSEVAGYADSSQQFFAALGRMTQALDGLALLSGLLAVGLGGGGLLQRHAGLSRGMGWLAGVGLGITALGMSLQWPLAHLSGELRDTVAGLEAEHAGVAVEGVPIGALVLSYCGGAAGEGGGEVVRDAAMWLRSVAVQVNGLAGAEVVRVGSADGEVTVEELRAQAESIQFWVGSLMALNASELSARYGDGAMLRAPLSLGVSIARELVGLADCRGESTWGYLLSLRGELEELSSGLWAWVDRTAAQAALLLCVAGASAVAVYVMERPRKLWQLESSRRWFRFRVSFLAHKRLHERRQRRRKRADPGTDDPKDADPGTHDPTVLGASLDEGTTAAGAQPATGVVDDDDKAAPSLAVEHHVQGAAAGGEQEAGREEEVEKAQLAERGESCVGEQAPEPTSHPRDAHGDESAPRSTDGGDPCEARRASMALESIAGTPAAATVPTRGVEMLGGGAGKGDAGMETPTRRIHHLRPLPPTPSSSRPSLRGSAAEADAAPGAQSVAVSGASVGDSSVVGGDCGANSARTGPGAEEFGGGSSRRAEGPQGGARESGGSEHALGLLSVLSWGADIEWWDDQVYWTRPGWSWVAAEERLAAGFAAMELVLLFVAVAVLLFAYGAASALAMQDTVLVVTWVVTWACCALEWLALYERWAASVRREGDPDRLEEAGCMQRLRGWGGAAVQVLSLVSTATSSVVPGLAASAAGRSAWACVAEGGAGLSSSMVRTGTVVQFGADEGECGPQGVTEAGTWAMMCGGLSVASALAVGTGVVATVGRRAVKVDVAVRRLQRLERRRREGFREVVVEAQGGQGGAAGGTEGPGGEQGRVRRKRGRNQQQCFRKQRWAMGLLQVLGLGLLGGLLILVLTARGDLRLRGQWGRGGEPAEEAERCNGVAGLCGVRYSAATHAMVHNAYSSRDDGFALPNNLRSMRAALRAGVRGLMLDLVLGADGGVRLCHADCALGSTGLREGMAAVREFLAANAREVVTVMWELNGGDAGGEMKRAINQTLADAQMLSLMHRQAPSQPWPTLGEMLQSGRRLVFFTDAAAGQYEWDNSFHDFVSQTPYSVKSRADIAQGCALRGSGDRPLFLMNHFLTNPLASPSLATSINYNPVLLDRARRCEVAGDDGARRVVNYIAVDFWSLSHLLPVVAELNAEHVWRS